MIINKVKILLFSMLIVGYQIVGISNLPKGGNNPNKLMLSEYDELFSFFKLDQGYDSVYLSDNSNLLKLALLITGLSSAGYSENSIDSITFVQSTNISNIGKVNIYKGYLNSDELSNAWRSRFYLITNIRDNEAYLLWVDKIELLKFQQVDSYYLGAIYLSQRSGLGRFVLIDYENRLRPSVLLESGFDDQEVFFYPYLNNSCISTKNEYLYLENIDLNNDELNDLKFSGSLSIKCPEIIEKLETTANNTGTSVEINVTYYTVISDGKMEWKLKDDSFARVYKIITEPH